MRVAIIGGGAAGFFAAYSVRKHHPDAEISIFEKTKKLLSKVKVSGGGRCNVTNGCASIKQLSLAYPRGSKSLRKLFQQYNNRDVMSWFTERGVPLVEQEDGCIFPVSQNSQSIIDALVAECRRGKVNIAVGHMAQSIFAETASASESKLGQASRVWRITFRNSGSQSSASSQSFDKVIITTGGSPKPSGLEWLANMGHRIEQPVPSLFTFNMPTESITELMGVVVEQAQISIPSTNLKGDGPLLITHWGMSGPAVLKLSAFGARYLSGRDYQLKVAVNWINETNFDKVFDLLSEIVTHSPQKIIANQRPHGLPDRLWKYLLQRAEVEANKKWQDLGKKGLHKLTRILTVDEYQVSGKTTFKEEFVTCGGVSLDSVNMQTLQSKVCSGIYFAGEVLDIDGITGGYNFQAAWTTAYIAGQLAE